MKKVDVKLPMHSTGFMNEETYQCIHIEGCENLLSTEYKIEEKRLSRPEVIEILTSFGKDRVEKFNKIIMDIRNRISNVL